MKNCVGTYGEGCTERRPAGSHIQCTKHRVASGGYLRYNPHPASKSRTQNSSNKQE